MGYTLLNTDCSVVQVSNIHDS